MTRTKNLYTVSDNFYSDKARQERSEFLAKLVNGLKQTIRQTLTACLQQFKVHA